MYTKIMEKIKEIPLFSKLSDDSIKKLENISYFKKYNADEIVFYEGDAPGILHILTDGVLRLYKTDNKNHEIFIYQFTPPAIIGELANFENIPFPATGKFITSGQLLKIDFKKLESDFFCDSKISLEIIKSLTKKVKILSNVIHHEMVLSSEAKIAKFLFEHKNVFETVRNNQIASILNISPETLSRTLTKFKKANYISINKEYKITLINKIDLQKLFK